MVLSIVLLTTNWQVRTFAREMPRNLRGSNDTARWIQGEIQKVVDEVQRESEVKSVSHDIHDPAFVYEVVR